MESSPIHQRTITVNTFEIDDKTLVVEGTLVDDRLCKTYIRILSATVDPKIVHRISLKLHISVLTLTITQATMTMHEVPHAACRDIKDIGDKLVGVSLLKGFNKTVTQLISGKNGCLHLYNLLLSMRASAFQGFMTFLSRVLEDGSLRQYNIDESYLINTCHVWSESGQFAALLREMRKESEKSGTRVTNPLV